MLGAVAALPGSARILVGTAATGDRLELAIPFHPAALSALAPGAVVPPEIAPRGLRIRAEGSSVITAVTTEGAIGPDGVVAELAPPSPGRDAWHALLAQFCAVGSGRISGRARGVGTAWAAVQVTYPPRDRDGEAYVMAAIDQLSEDIGATAAQRRLWIRMHPELGRGGEVAVETALRDGVVSRSLAISYPITAWDVGVRLAQGLILNDSEAEAVPRRFGAVAGALGADTLSSVTLELGPVEPPAVVVWAQLAPAA